jgi:hypothetical protein
MQVLDALEAALGPGDTANALTAARAPALNGCRPGTLPGGGASLDARLASAMGPPGPTLATIAADVDAVIGSAIIESTLTVDPPAAGILNATHTLDTVKLSLPSGATMSYDLAASGAPIVSVRNVPLAISAPPAAAMVTIGEHGFAARLPVLWGRAVSDLVLPAALPALNPATAEALVAQLIAQTSYNGTMGCAAIDQLGVDQAGTTPGALLAACAAAPATVAAALDAGFAGTSGVDLPLAGSGTPFDRDADLVVDGLTMGIWVTSAADQAGFVGTQMP